MRDNYKLPITHSILILTSCICLSSYPSRTIAATTNPAPIPPTILTPGIKHPEVQVIQVQLKALGYYNGLIDGEYNGSTQKAVTRFQQEKGLRRVDGIADWATRQDLKDVLIEKINCNSSPTTSDTKNIQSQPQAEYTLWLRLISLGILGSLCLFYYFIQKLGDTKPVLESENLEKPLLSASSQNNPKFFLNPAQTLPPLQSLNSPELLLHQQNSVLPTITLFDKFMEELQSDDTTKRRKAIWNIGQKGDSRAVQPLVELLMNADSQQNGLILSALAEIGIRTLKPMNRALAISIQSENPQVRQNAIRDLVRLYDMMAQMSQILRHALEDTDPEVQATARYALNQINRLRVVPDQQRLTEN
ncbi:peptidoglycan-binding protein [Anabaena sp. UHCC 0187]|uniref:peptidoglycan-binding protein n=1 Tax=Anabaena sp. UHCC 0187 TaxID=2590018 RepID=UPI001446FBA0|nr:peptidoglycan-binding protein [Anabaena sp. UHCC 0187]MTJ13441.1 peptidoglycan-binding protein [Anabaena sp. UHCC 0187]